MKKILFPIIALSLTMTTLTAQTLDRSIRPKAGPAPEVKLGSAESFVLENGLKVFVVENHKLPSVTYSIQLDVQPAGEADKAGAAQFAGSLITAGTKSRNKDKFNEEVDAIGGSIQASAEGIFGQSLVKNQERLLELMSDALMNADFKKDELDKMKKQAISGLESSSNNAEFMVGNVSKTTVYGAEHPYGEVMTRTTVNNITLDDCKNYYSTYFRPNVAYLAIVGDITLAKAKELANKYFGKWQKADVPRTEYPAAYAPATAMVDFAPRAGAVQSVINISYPIQLKPGTPDVLKARVLNEILGGSSQGRLFQNLREKHGWTYGAYSSISPDPVVGSFSAHIKCRNEVTDSAIDETLKEMQAIRDKPVSDEELNNTKNYLAGTFALGLESPQTIAQYAINIDRYNMPKDYYQNYLKNLAAIRAIDVQGMAKRYIAPKNAQIIVSGNKTELDKLKRFSTEEIRFYDAFGKPVQSTESKIIDGVSIGDVMTKYIDAIGGKSAIESLVDLSVTADYKRGMQQMTLIRETISPDKYLQEQRVIMKNQTMSISQDAFKNQDAEVLYGSKLVINGEKGFQESQGKRNELPAGMIKEYKSQSDLQVLIHPEKYAISLALLGETGQGEQINGEDCYIVEKGENEGNKRSIQYYGKKSGYLLKEMVTTQREVTISEYSDYKEVKGGNGYKIPWKTVQGSTEIIVTTARANGGLKANNFK